MSSEPTTTASVTLYPSSSRRGASGHSSCWKVFERASHSGRYQTFHSSKERVIRLLDFSRAPTWSAVATTASMKDSMSTAEARKESTSPSSGQ